LHGNLIGAYHSNPVFNTAIYDIEFSDGLIHEYSANIIAENLYSQVRGDEYHSSQIDTIVDFNCTNDAIPLSQAWVTTKSGQK